MTKQLLPPQSWDEFEHLCRDLWAELLSDSETKMHGRRGQTQSGIDVYGYDHKSGTSALVGIQCKGKDNFLKRNVTELELRVEVKKATSFRPKLSKFILATTGVRDVNVQKFTRIINSKTRSANKFIVSTWSWSDISDEIQNYPALLGKYYPETLVRPNLTRTRDSVIFRLPLSSDHEQKIAALFEIDEITCELQSDFRDEIRDLVVELASNAYRHGHAKKLEVEISAKKIILRDNGTAFNPLLSAISDDSEVKMQGLKYVNYFMSEYEEQLDANYQYDQESSSNIVSLVFNKPIVRIEPDRCVISFSDYAFIGRADAMVKGAAQQFPEECEVYTMYIDRKAFSMSSLYGYLDVVVSRLPAGKKLRIVLPNKAHKPMVDEWFDPGIVEVIVH